MLGLLLSGRAALRRRAARVGGLGTDLPRDAGGADDPDRGKRVGNRRVRAITYKKTRLRSQWIL